ncbi:MAG: type II secretion system GspH family protein, partial [Lachnospiraceae bacterium]|nr:type II secretion system GspH family protein [Lachnospiraceae bacterium]
MKRIYHIKERDNRGLSLLELIAVIAIMAVLTGLLVPMFGKYISDKRTMACEENREAILNVFEKCVYGTGTEETLGGGQQSIIMATDHDIKLLLSASTGGESDYNNLVIPAEYKEEIKSHY